QEAAFGDRLPDSEELVVRLAAVRVERDVGALELEPSARRLDLAHVAGHVLALVVHELEDEVGVADRFALARHDAREIVEGLLAVDGHEGVHRLLDLEADLGGEAGCDTEEEDRKKRNLGYGKQERESCREAQRCTLQHGGGSLM